MLLGRKMFNENNLVRMMPLYEDSYYDAPNAKKKPKKPKKTRSPN